MSAQPSLNSRPYLRMESGSIAFRGERAGEVRIPNYVYDLWMPLLGPAAIGLYAAYTRLARNGRIWGMTVGDIAKSCRMSKSTVGKINQELQECGFIKVYAPKGQQRYRHYTIEISVFNAPCEVPPAIIRAYQHPQGYEPLSHWLIADATEPQKRVLDGNSGSTNQSPNCKNSTAMIASLIASLRIDLIFSYQILNVFKGEGADAPPPENVFIEKEKEEEALKQEESQKPTLRIVEKPTHSKQESNAPRPPSSAPPPKAAKPAPADMSPEAARSARTLVELAIEKLCYGSQYTAWDNKISRGKMIGALEAIRSCDPAPLTGARIEEAGRWWYAGGSWIGRKKGERPEPSQLAEKWASFMAGVYESEVEPPKVEQKAQPAAVSYPWQRDDDSNESEQEQTPLPAPIKRDSVPDGVKNVWTMCIGQLKAQLSPSTFGSWLGHAKLSDYEYVHGDHVIYIEVPHIYAADWLEKHLKASMVQNFERDWKLSRLETGKVELVFEVAE